MSKRIIENHRPVYPSPAALISCATEAGVPNIISLAEVFNISINNPVIIGIAIREATYSHGIISKTKEFVINLPSTGLMEAVDRCGSVSGRTGIDKFSSFGLTPLKATKVSPPIIAECPMNIECVVTSITKIGDHDLILGEVVAVHVDDDTLDSEGNPDVAKLDGIAYLRSEYWSLGKKLEKHGYTRKEE